MKLNLPLFKKENRSEFIISTFFAFVFSFPITGFLYGLIAPSGTGGFMSELKGRLFLGVFTSVASLTSWGRPFGDNAEKETLIFRCPVFIVLLMLIPFVFRIVSRKKKM